MWRDSAVSSGVAGLPVKLAEVTGDKLEATSRGTDEAHRDLAARMRDRDLAEILRLALGLGPLHRRPLGLSLFNRIDSALEKASRFLRAAANVGQTRPVAWVLLRSSEPSPIARRCPADGVNRSTARTQVSATWNSSPPPT